MHVKSALHCFGEFIASYPGVREEDQTKPGRYGSSCVAGIRDTVDSDCSTILKNIGVLGSGEGIPCVDRVYGYTVEDFVVPPIAERTIVVIITSGV